MRPYKQTNPPGVHGTRVLQPISCVAKNICRNRVRYLRRVHTKFKVKMQRNFIIDGVCGDSAKPIPRICSTFF